MKDSQIILSIQTGGKAKEQAVQYLINEHLGFVYKIQKSHKISLEQAKDCYTDAIMGFILSIDQQRFRKESKVSTYLYQIFYFKCMDLLRKQTTNQVKYSEQLQETQDYSADTLHHLLIKDEVKQLHVHLNQLGNPCKQILLDWGFWGYKMSEIAERTQLENADQAKRKKYRCLQKLLSVISKN